MSTARGKRLRVRFSVWFLVLLTCMLALDETGLTALAFFCVLAHETGHLLALWRLGVPVDGLVFCAFGAQIDAPGRALLSYPKEAAVDLAGPAANFLCCGVFWLFWRLGWCGALAAPVCAVSLLLGLFNLLPVAGLDGAGALEAFLLARASPAAVRRTMRVISVLTLVPLAVFGCWLFWRARNATLLLCVVYLTAAMTQTAAPRRTVRRHCAGL